MKIGWAFRVMVVLLSCPWPLAAQDGENPEASAYPVREWESRAGTKVMARLATFLSRDEVTLVTGDSKILKLKTTDVSDQDQQYLRTIWYRTHPLRVISVGNGPGFLSPMFFFDSLQAKIAPWSRQIGFPAWTQLDKSRIEGMTNQLRQLGLQENERVYFVDSTWRSYVAGSGSVAGFTHPLRKLLSEFPYDIRVILVDDSLDRGGLWGRDRNGTLMQVVDIEEGLLGVDEFTKEQDFGPKVRFLKLRKLKKQVEKTLPTWNLEKEGAGREMDLLRSSALATLITGQVPPLQEVQERMITERKRNGHFPPIPENSFLALPETSLAKLAQILQILTVEPF